MRITLIGAQGFVGSAFAHLLGGRVDIELVCVTRQNYEQHVGVPSDIVIEAACNSKKFLADEQPLVDFEASVGHRLRTLLQFPAEFHLHISSVDVYSDLSSPAHTAEDAEIDIAKVSRYGCHKLLAEQLVRHYAKKWLIVRLAGMVGPNLRKNPVYDIVHGQPLRIHPDSQYQFMHTHDVARITWDLVEAGRALEVLNLAGNGLISPRQIAAITGRSLDLSLLPETTRPRIVNVNLKRIRKDVDIPETEEAIRRFLASIKTS